MKDRTDNESALDVTLRRARPEDKEALHAFAREAWPRNWRTRVPHRWRWLYEENPFIPDGELPIWIALDKDDHIVAQTTAIREPLLVHGVERLIGWGASATTLPACRRQGIGTALENLNVSSQQIAARLGMPEQMRRNMRNLGSVPIDNVGSYSLVLRSNPLHAATALFYRLGRAASMNRYLLGLRRIAHAERSLSALLARLLTPRPPQPEERRGVAQGGPGAEREPAGPAKRGSMDVRPDGEAPVPGNRGLTIREIERFGAETDALWKAVRPRYQVIVRRDAQFCNWKYLDQPHMHYRRWFAWRGEDPRGYMVLRTARSHGSRLGIVADLFAAPDDEATCRALLALAVDHFRSKQVHRVQAATTIESIGRYLEQEGFARTGTETPMAYLNDESEGIREPGVWFLSKSDCDWDQFPLSD